MHNANPLETASQGERASLTSQDAPDSTDADINGKRKTPPLHTGNRFKAVGTMVLAMRRFQGELRASAAPREACEPRSYGNSRAWFLRALLSPTHQSAP